MSFLFFLNVSRERETDRDQLPPAPGPGDHAASGRVPQTRFLGTREDARPTEPSGPGLTLLFHIFMLKTGLGKEGVRLPLPLLPDPVHSSVGLPDIRAALTGQGRLPFAQRFP